ncbi:ferritin family protein [Clostridium estertheticum]|uniref:ferritin-like domain-containing protein n=1 Tax=Clostridium estertheticum TaxID=238834 RepID=UPI0013EEBAF3|nr:ferritin family protein [Clostridium estertheticum]MBZ9608681.1 ferritin family protein [Clostridium estertheticum]
MKCLICGMEININNFNINNDGLLEVNEREHIKYCPFCGVTYKYLKSVGEAYKICAQSLDPNTLVVLDHAMKLEIFNSEFYMSAAKLASDNHVKEIFKALSKIEKIHAIVHQKLGGFKELPKLVDIDYSKYKNDTSLMKLAGNREVHATKFYEKHAKEINNLIVKEVFVALAEVERSHIQIARNY